MAVTVTKEWINKYTGMSINTAQLRLLDYEKFDDAKKGWKEEVEGKIISNARAELFILLQGARGKKLQASVIKNYKQASYLNNLNYI